MRHSMRFAQSLTIAIVLAGTVACGSDPASAPSDLLPAGFSERSDVPYVRGVIIFREDEAAGIRIRVKDRDGSDWRTTEAIVGVHADVLLRWRDGAPASFHGLRVGRRVMVWTTGVELRSAPPQVFAEAILLERR